MDAVEIIKILQEKGYLIAPEALEKIQNSTNPEELANRALENVKEELIINLDDLEHKETTKISAEGKEVVIEKTTFKSVAKDIEPDVKVIDNINAKESTSLGRLEDFVEYFQDRYTQMHKMLKERGKSIPVKIKDLGKTKNKEVKIIGIVNEKIKTKNGHILVRVEDFDSSVNVLIPVNNRQLIEMANYLIPDEIIAVEGKLSKELFIANAIYEPDIPIREPKKTNDEVCLAMLSDLHIGSKLFMEKNFLKFMDWLKGKCHTYGNNCKDDLASRVKYITLAGDLTAGIGIYPGQENDLEITDVYEQYEKFSGYIMDIPEYIQIVICPGNHDAVKKADPQPCLPKKLVPDLYKLDNVTLISSPGMVELHGLKTLVYHGTSFIDFISNVSGLSFENCGKTMVEMLKKRHVHPIYGGRPITPERTDRLVIKEIPDIFHAGESHSNSYETYNGTICVNSGTWEQMSEYQIAQGHKATPCILPVVDMKRARVGVVHFDR